MSKATIYFGQTQKDPMRGEIDKLKPLVEAIEYPGTKVKLTGHASKEGSDSFNMRLSKDRAKSLEAYLIVMGAELQQMQVKGLGEKKPAVKERGSGSGLEKLRAKNRRVEVEYTIGKKPGPYKKLVDRTRERFKKGIAALRTRLQKAKAGRKRTLAHPKKLPVVLKFWNEEHDETASQLKEWEAMLKDLVDAERRLKDPRKVWLHIARELSYWDLAIQYQRDRVKATKARLAEAQKELAKATDETERKFWVAMVQDYKDVLKAAETELGCRIKDKQRAAQK